MSNVVKMYPNDAAKNPDSVLEQAVGQYEDVLIIGWSGDYLDARATLGLNAAEILWLIECFKKKLINGDYAE